MVSPSSVTPSRRATRSQCPSDREANPKKIPRLGKTASLSSTESELEEAASTDQEEAASTEQDEAASTEPEFIVTTPTFPERLFARNCYPGKPRLNIYSKVSIIGSLVKLLRGSPEMNCLLGNILLVETQTEVIVTYSIPNEGGDQKWKKEVIDPKIDNLVRRMREGHEFKATDFRGGDSSLPPLKPVEKAEGVGVKKKCQKPSRRFGKACDEPGSSTQAPQRPIRPRRGICKQAEPGNLSDKEQELKELIFEVYRNTDLFGLVFWLIVQEYSFVWSGIQGEGGDESPILGLNLLAEEVEKGIRSDNVYKDPQENTCRMLTVWSHPESYVLPPEEQGGKASPTNSEDYKTPPEDDPMTECRTPDVGNSKLSRYLTREFEIVIGIHVSNKFFLSLARPTNWVSTEHISVLISMLVRRHGRNYLSRRCRFVDYFSIAGIISKFAEFEKASDKLGFNWGGLGLEFRV
ncbi:hypothetical protein HID58_079822 [Brassica napus]|uniref:Uncharacterized protein n=1 Tax=Brassica napus TaxID=3708 RepID=A0ABQ7Y371_BRANA|nr:hypothetical protein HID58_079822 [Brassica napus]